MLMPIAIVSEKISEAQSAALKREGFAVLPCPPLRRIGAPIAHHPDMLMAVIEGALFCCEEYFKENGVFFSVLASLCPNLQVIPLPDAPDALYPKDCAYNLLPMGKRIFFNPQGIAPSLARVLAEKGMISCHTRQGYAACTVRAMGEGHAITADRGMAKILAQEGISVLLIREGGIALPPYTHGFIGGASGCFGNAVYFSGKIEAHPDYVAIRQFANEAGFRMISLSEEPLCDIGGILFIE